MIRKKKVLYKEPETQLFNTRSDVTGEFIEGELFASTLTPTKTTNEIKDMLANVDDKHEDIVNLMTYYWISNGEIRQLYWMYKCLSNLNFKIRVFDNESKQFEKNMSLVNKTLYKVKYKELTRDLITQAMLDGGVVCTWLGTKQTPYLYVFNNPEYVFAKYRKNGEWQCVIDLAWFDNMNEEEQEAVINNLSPLVTTSKVNAYKDNPNDDKKRYIELPIDKTSYIRGEYLRRNQLIGVPLGSPALIDLNHKETLKNAEKAIATRIVKTIATLTLGLKEDELRTYENIPNKKGNKIISDVIKALNASTDINNGKIPLAVMPEYATLNLSKIDGVDGLDPDKFDSVNYDINNSTGMSSALSSGSGDSNYALAKINLDFNYKKLNVILEQIQDVFNKLIAIILPKNAGDNFHFEFMTNEISPEKQLDVLLKLQAQGYSVKAIIDMLPDVSFDDFVEQSIYENEVLKLRDKIVPPQTSYTLAGKDFVGSSKPTNDNPTNESTIKTQATDGNNTPEANT